jgi:putative ABC transport system permease protein
MERALDLWIHTWRTVRGNALRYGLTSLGIVWGIFTLTLLQSVTDGFDLHFRAQVNKVGERLVVLMPGVAAKATTGQRDGRRIAFEAQDVDSVGGIRSIEAVTPQTVGGERVVRAADRTKLMLVIGVSEQAEQVRGFEVGEGRFLSAGDRLGSERVVFLGLRAKERLFGSGAALGKTVRIDSLPFRVVGISRPKGSQMLNFGPNDDEMVLIPYTTAQRWFTQSNAVGDIFAQTRSTQGSRALEVARILLGLNHALGPAPGEAIETFDLEEVLGIIRTLGLGLSIFFVATSVITLLVGAVGVMNIMLVIVGERTREIGLRKALGAPSSAIFVELLAEAVLVTSLAGAVGIALGWAMVVGSAAQIPVEPLTGQPLTSTPVLTPLTVAIAAGTLVLVGVAAGTLPALRAMRVAPAEALRS